LEGFAKAGKTILIIFKNKKEIELSMYLSTFEVLNLLQKQFHYDTTLTRRVHQLKIYIKNQVSYLIK
jgi:hypothetical protein